MNDVWHALEERTRAWHALGRQSLADVIWEDYVTFRFGQTGDPRALDSLDYFTKHPDLFIRDRAVRVLGAARIVVHPVPLARA